MDIPVPISAARGREDFLNQAGEPLPPQLRRARGAFSVPVIALAGETRESAADLNGHPGIDEASITGCAL